jgi:hypothetical protein
MLDERRRGQVVVDVSARFDAELLQADRLGLQRALLVPSDATLLDGGPSR